MFRGLMMNIFFRSLRVIYKALSRLLSGLTTTRLSAIRSQQENALKLKELEREIDRDKKRS